MGVVPLTPEEVDHVAMLARLGLDDEERERLRVELSAILDHVSRLQAIDTRDVDETTHASGAVNVWREDEPRPPMGAGPVLAEAPGSDGEWFVVGAIQDVDA
jgi:aspartyl-tRNA(Asn)/glutamyl-tRNA(Gln) amidotransferase subunit C